MAYTQAELSGPVQLGDDKKIFYYDANDASDAIASVLASGYFNNSDDEIRMEVEDLIHVRATDGVYLLRVSASTGGAVTTVLADQNTPVESGATSANLSAWGLSSLDASTGAERTYNMTAPTHAGQMKYLLAGSDTDHVITSTEGYSFGTTGATSLTITGSGTVGVGVTLIAKSTTQYLIASAIDASTQGAIAVS